MTLMAANPPRDDNIWQALFLATSRTLKEVAHNAVCLFRVLAKKNLKGGGSFEIKA